MKTTQIIPQQYSFHKQWCWNRFSKVMDYLAMCISVSLAVHPSTVPSGRSGSIPYPAGHYFEVGCRGLVVVSTICVFWVLQKLAKTVSYWIVNKTVSRNNLMLVLIVTLGCLGNPQSLKSKRRNAKNVDKIFIVPIPLWPQQFETNYKEDSYTIWWWNLFKEAYNFASVYISIYLYNYN